MIKYLIEVRRNSVIAYFEDELSNVHYRAIINGWDYAYQIIQARESFNKPCDDWFKRGGQYVHYHANSLDDSVKWLPVTPEFKSRANSKSDRARIEKWDYLKPLQNNGS